MRFLVYAYKDLYSTSDAPTYVDNVRERLYELYGEYVKAYKTLAEENSSEGSSMEKTSTVGGKRSRGRKDFDIMMRNVDITDGEKSKLDAYLEERITLHNDEVDSAFDALDWWRQQTAKFCILSRMACDVLSTPITTVASESAFSAGGRVIDSHCASLGANTGQMLMCTADWCRAHYGMRRTGEDVCTEEIDRLEFPLWWIGYRID